MCANPHIRDKKNIRSKSTQLAAVMSNDMTRILQLNRISQPPNSSEQSFEDFIIVIYS